MSVAGFKLTLWIPVEQVGIVIGRSGQTINKIQGGTFQSSQRRAGPGRVGLGAGLHSRARRTVCLRRRNRSWNSSTKIDDCVAEFHLGGRGRTLLRDENSGPSNLTLETKKVSADHKVRILIPQATGNAKATTSRRKTTPHPAR